MSGYKKVEWINGANIYEVNIRQYSEEGTFGAFAKHLHRLKDMGVEILWMMPVTPISIEKRQGTLGSYYACSSYTAINAEYGTIDDFKALVNEVHRLDMKIIIDWVANHTGWDHHWTKEQADWYIKDDSGNFTEQNGWQDVIDLNYQNEDMRAAMIDAMMFWIRECNIDGFRCDMAHLVPLDFWKTARQKCDELKPLLWLAECDVADYHEAFDISYAWDWMHVSEKLSKQIASIQHMDDVLDKYTHYPNDALKLFFTSNHDENSWNGTEYEKYGGAAKAFAVFCCTWPGIPLIYSGQEMPNYKRLKFFDKDPIEWNNKFELHEFYKSLLRLKKNNTALQNAGNLNRLVTGADDKIFAYLLSHENNKVVVLINFSPEEKIVFKIQHEKLGASYYNLFSGLQYTLNNEEKFEMQPWEYAVYSTGI